MAITKDDMDMARAAEFLARKHWTYHRLAEVPDWKGGEKALAKRLLKMYRVSY